MKRRSVILVMVAVTVVIAFAVLTRRPNVISISSARCAMENGKIVVRFLAQNRSSASKKVTVEITVYSKQSNGISNDPVVAWVRKTEFNLNPKEAKAVTEEVSIAREPLALVGFYPMVDVRLVGIE